jgi:class 3 adenylate cyclase
LVPFEQAALALRQLIVPFRLIIVVVALVAASLTISRYPLLAKVLFSWAGAYLAGSWLYYLGRAARPPDEQGQRQPQATAGGQTAGGDFFKGILPRWWGNYPANRPANLYPGKKIARSARSFSRVTFLICDMRGLNQFLSKDFRRALHFLDEFHRSCFDLMNKKVDINKILGDGFLAIVKNDADPTEVLDKALLLQRTMQAKALSEEHGLNLEGVGFCLRTVDAFLGPTGTQRVYSDYSVLGSDVNQTFKVVDYLVSGAVLVGEELVGVLHRPERYQFSYRKDLEEKFGLRLFEVAFPRARAAESGS